MTNCLAGWLIGWIEGRRDGWLSHRILISEILQGTSFSCLVKVPICYRSRLLKKSVSFCSKCVLDSMVWWKVKVISGHSPTALLNKYARKSSFSFISGPAVRCPMVSVFFTACHLEIRDPYLGIQLVMV